MSHRCSKKAHNTSHPTMIGIAADPEIVIMFLYVHNSSQECTQRYPILSSFYADISEDEDEVYGDTFHLIQKLIITLKAHYCIHFMVMSSLKLI